MPACVVAKLLLRPLYAKLPDLSGAAGTALPDAQNGAIRTEPACGDVNDADALQLDGALAFDAKGELKKLKLDHFQASFPAAYQRYGQAWLSYLWALRNA